MTIFLNISYLCHSLLSVSFIMYLEDTRWGSSWYEFYHWFQDVLQLRSAQCEKTSNSTGGVLASTDNGFLHLSGWTCLLSALGSFWTGARNKSLLYCFSAVIPRRLQHTLPPQKKTGTLWAVEDCGVLFMWTKTEWDGEDSSQAR